MRFLAPLIFVFMLCGQAWAAPEDICPGGSSPRGDIEWCMDFETLGNCATGQESSCVSDNGLTSLNAADIEGFKIKTCPITAAVGTGCIYGSGKPGGTGPGYSTKTFTARTSVSYRYYVKFGKGYLQAPNTFGGNHFPGPTYSDGGSCTGIFAVDVNAGGLGMSVEVNNPAACGANTPNSFSLANNIDSTFIPENDVWYLIEQRIVMNTTAGSTSPTSGNGTMELWIDGVLRAQHTNLNIRGPSVTAVIDNMYAARSYYGPGVPAHKPIIYFDNFAYSNNGTYIGASTSENALGTADTSSPYVNYTAYQGFEGNKMQSDCAQPASFSRYPQTGMDFQWRAAPTYVTSPAQNTYVNDCIIAPAVVPRTRAMSAKTTSASDGSGVYGDLKLVDSRYVIHGSINLDSTNDYASDTPLFGFSRYGSATNYDYGLMVGRNAAGNLMLWQKSNPTIVKTDLGIAVTTDAWHEFELHAASTGKVSLYWDGAWVLDEVTPSASFWTWLSDTASAGARKWNIGIFDASPSSAFTIYYDDVDIGTTSFISSRGWGTSSPFATPTPTPTPTPEPRILPILLGR